MSPLGLPPFPGSAPPASDRGFQPELRHGLLLRLLFLGWIAIGLFAVAYAAVGLRVLPIVELCFFVAVGLSILWVRRDRSRVRAVALLQGSGILAVIVINTVVLGGFAPSGGFAIWSYLAPVAAFFLLEGRARVGLIAVTACFLVAELVIEPHLTPIESLPPASLPFFFFLNVSCTIVVIVGGLAYFHGRLQAENLALSASERRHRLILEQVPVAIALKDDSNQYLFVNRTFEETFSVTSARIVADGDAVWSPDDAAAFAAAEAAARGEDEPVPTEELLHAHGETRVLHSSRQRIHLADGRDGLCWVAEDITDRVRSEQAGQNQRHLEALGTLAGGIAHDFNNLLMAVQGNLELLALDRDPARLNARLDSATRAVDRARDLTRQILTFARGGAPNLAPTALAGLVEESARFALTGTATRLVMEAPEGLPAATADASQVARVIHNLVLNAAQAMPDGGVVRVQVAVAEPEEVPEHLAQDRGYLRITVADQGHGIEPALLRRVLDPFFTTRPRGSGLGLTTSHSIVRQHDGELRIASTVGVGTTVTLLLPTAERPVPAPAPALPVAPPPSGSARLLVMDDDVDVREVLVAMLSGRGHQVDECADGEEAVRRYGEALAAGEPYAVVFLDLTVPGGMGGIAAAERILALDPAARLIAASGYVEANTHADLLGRGFRAALEKPFSVRQAAQAVFDALGDR